MRVQGGMGRGWNEGITGIEQGHREDDAGQKWCKTRLNKVKKTCLC